MKWADKIDTMEVGRASDEAVAAILNPWARANLQLRADRDALNEHCRASAEARCEVETFALPTDLSIENRLAAQQARTAQLAATASWR